MRPQTNNQTFMSSKKDKYKRTGDINSVLDMDLIKNRA